MNIENFIARATSLGSLDSEGVFTLAQEKAVEKLSSFQLPRPEAWILKLLQAAVASGADRLEVRTGGNFTFFSCSPQELFEVDALADSLLCLQQTPSEAAEHLAVGLRAVGFGAKRAFTLAFEQGCECFLLAWDGKKLAQMVENLPQPNHRLMLRIAVAHPARDSRFPHLLSNPPAVEAELAELAAGAEVCPIPVLVNGKRVDTLTAPLVDPGHGLGKRVVLSVGWSPHQEGMDLPKLGLPGGISTLGSGMALTDRFTDKRVFHVVGDARSQDLSCIVKLSYGYHVDSHRSSLGKFRLHNKPRHSYVHWVKDGVVCDRHRWRFEPAAVAFDLYLSAEGLATDATGLSVVRRADVAHRVGRALPWVGEQARQTSQALGGRLPRPFGYHSALAGLFALLALGSPPVALFQIFAGGVAVAQIGLSLYDKYQLMGDATRHLDRLAQDMERKGA